MKDDVLSVIEAGYRVELTETAWVEGIMHAARPLLDTGLGVFAYVVDASNPAQVEMRSFSHAGQPPGFHPRTLLSALGQTPQQYIERSWRGRSCGLVSEMPGFAKLERLISVFNPLGIGDIFAVNGLDPTSQGCYLRAAMPAIVPLNPRKRALWSRVGAHLAAGFRLRRGLRDLAGIAPEGEAILSPSGKIEHASGVAIAPAAQKTLKQAVLRMDRARSKTRRASPEDAVEEWRGLVAARWSLLEHFAQGGRRYLIARRNDPDAAGPEALTRRERQVVGYVALGHSNKLVAYELGISPSTVGVLLLRAARKFGVRTRAEVIATWRSFVASDR